MAGLQSESNPTVVQQACSGLELFKIPACRVAGYPSLTAKTTATAAPAFSLASIAWLQPYPEALIVFYWRIASLLMMMLQQ